jgi:short-subunit dehydrogenase
MKLLGKRVFISGAGSGFGRELALKLSLEKGAHIVAADIDENALAKLSQDILKYDGLISTVVLDVRSKESLKNLIDREFENNHIDIWINNAGIVDLGLFHEQSLESIEAMIDINFKAYCFATRLIMTAMEDYGRGLIVNMGSLAGEVPAPYISTYAATKYAITGLTLSLQEELRQRGSNVEMMLVNPGFARTTLNQDYFPEWFNPALTTASLVADDVIDAIEKGHSYITPGLNAKVLKAIYRRFPALTLRLSKMLLLKKPWHLFLNRFDLPNKKKTS